MFEIEWIKNKTSYILLEQSHFSISIGHPETSNTRWNDWVENARAKSGKIEKV